MELTVFQFYQVCLYQLDLALPGVKGLKQPGLENWRMEPHQRSKLSKRLRKYRLSEAVVNPLRPNSDLSQTSLCNIKGLSVSEVMRIENMITQVQFY